MQGQGGGRVLKLANMKKNYKVEGFVLEKVKCKGSGSLLLTVILQVIRGVKKRFLSKIVTCFQGIM